MQIQNVNRTWGDRLVRHGEPILLGLHSVVLILAYVLIARNMVGLSSVLILGIALPTGRALTARGLSGPVTATMRTIHLLVAWIGAGWAATMVFLGQPHQSALGVWLNMIILVGLVIPTVLEVYKRFRAYAGDFA